MADTTANYNLPFLELGDPPDIAGITEDLATAVDAELLAANNRINTVTAFGFQFIRKTADEAVVNNAALQWDDDLQFVMPASTRHLVEATLFVEVEGNNSTTDFRCGWALPANGAAAAFGGIGPAPALASGSAVGDGNWGALYGTFDGSLTYGLYSTGVTMITLKGIITNGASTGTARFAWSQAVAAAQAVTVRANSYLRVNRVS